jgi:hypothetical protein
MEGWTYVFCESKMHKKYLFKGIVSWDLRILLIDLHVLWFTEELTYSSKTKCTRVQLLLKYLFKGIVSWDFVVLFMASCDTQWNSLIPRTWNLQHNGYCNMYCRARTYLKGKAHEIFVSFLEIPVIHKRLHLFRDHEIHEITIFPACRCISSQSSVMCRGNKQKKFLR